MKKGVEAVDTSRVNIIEVVGFSSPMNKIGCPNYVSYNEDSLIYKAADIEDVYGLSLDVRVILYQLQIVV